MTEKITAESAVLTPGPVPSGDVLTYEYGARLDPNCLGAALNQIALSRKLYNNIVASIRSVVDDMNQFVLSKAGDDGRHAQDEVDRLNTAFQEAKARNDEQAMKQIAQERRLSWRALGAILKAVRNAHRSAILATYLSRIGRNSGCDTYRLRCEAVAEGLGWATANATLDAALLAFKKSFQLGRPPRFAVGQDKDQDTLFLQFTAAGGIAATALLAGTHGELSLLPTMGCGRRKYGEFRFRLGAAKADVYATGTWQYHRPLPDQAAVALARLVRRRIGKDYKWAIQLVVRPPKPVRMPVGDRKALAAIHFGWSADISGRRVAAIADSPDPGCATLVQLPPQIELDLDRAAQIQGERDAARDEVIPQVKALLPPDGASNAITELLHTIRPLRSQYVSANRLHYLCRLLMEHDCLPDWLSQWRLTDRERWQAHTHIARRARNTRRDFYRNLAIRIGRQYSTIIIEPLALAEGARKVDEVSGEKTEFSRKARSGRVVAALYEFESALRWAAVKTEAAFLELAGRTADTCSMCGGTTRTDAADGSSGQRLYCDDCGAELDRKLNGAARAYQLALPLYESATEGFWIGLNEGQEKAKTDRIVRQTKMATARRARTSSDGVSERDPRSHGNKDL